MERGFFPNHRVLHLIWLLTGFLSQRKDDEIRKLNAHVKRTEALVATLRAEISELKSAEPPQTVVRKPSTPLTPPVGSRASFGGHYEPERSQEERDLERRKQLEKQLSEVEQANEDLERALRHERSQQETKDVIIQALQSTVTDLKRRVEELDIELGRLRLSTGEAGASFESMINSVAGRASAVQAAAAKQEPKKVITMDKSDHHDDDDDDDVESMQDLIVYKVRYSMRSAADEEFLDSWIKLTQALESSRMANVERDLKERGELSPSVDDLKRIAVERLNGAQDQARLMMLSPSFKELPYAKHIFSHMERHINLLKAFNQTIINLKRLQLSTASPTSSAKKWLSK